MINRNIRIGKNNYNVSSDDQYLSEMPGDFEPYMVQIFNALIKKNDVVADVGANIGLTALLFSDLAQSVYAFEPSPSTFKILQNNLNLNAIKNVQTINIGLGLKSENLTITFAKNNRSGGFVSEKIRPDDGHISEDISIRTLDNFFADQHIVPSFLKIDVEGFEQNVINGGLSFINKHKPTVVMEMNHFCLDVLQRITIPDFLDFMRSVFPVLYAIDNDNSTIVDLHVPHQAYFVMHEHVVRQRFSNLVGGFSHDIKTKLESIRRTEITAVSMTNRLQSAVGRVMNKIVEGHVFDTPTATKIAGSIQVENSNVKLSMGVHAEFLVTIKNQSNGPWYGYGNKPVLLSYHWLNADGSIHLYEGLRTPLSCEVIGPGEQAKEVVNVQIPEIAGKYTLVLTVLQEGIYWFEDKGFSPALINITIE
jgi:FkbM family methyltransferase